MILQDRFPTIASHPVIFVSWLLASFLVLYRLARYVARTNRRRKFARDHGTLPPQNTVPGGDPFIGLSFLLETIRRAKKNEYMLLNLERFRSIGTTFVNKRLLFESVSTIDPENVQAVLSTHFDAFRMPEIRVQALSPLFGDGIFVNDGAKWAHARGQLRPLFSKRNLQPLLAIVEGHFGAMLQHMPGRHHETVDLGRLVYDLTLDVATEFLVGRSTHTLDPGRASHAEARFLADYLACCEEAVGTLQMGPLYQCKLRLRTRAARDRAWAYIDRYVDAALALRDQKPDAEAEDAHLGGYCFLRELARATDDRALLRTQILNVLLASRDTTAAHLGNFFFSMARHPGAYARLRAEVLEVVGPAGVLPTEEHFRRMPWLRWCINESLRLHPSVPGNTRQTSRDIALPVGGGPDGRSPMLVKKGTNVLLNLYSMHRREDIFGAEPEAFRPERWDGLQPGWGYVPFQGGPRTCIGQQFALTEASYVIARMAQHFAKIEPRDPRPFTEYYTIVLFSKHGVRVGLTPA
ncbi:cytochrome P450 [Xylariomycetidae sp. FL0641]|nr:cytochrome P450 [Xylariomycetidae sp. FL0641]